MCIKFKIFNSRNALCSSHCQSKNMCRNFQMVIESNWWELLKIYWTLCEITFIKNWNEILGFEKSVSSQHFILYKTKSFLSKGEAQLKQ